MISRPADDTYAKFESYHEDAVTITTPPLEVDAITNDDVIFTNDHFSGFTVKLKDEAWEKIHTDHRKTTVSYKYMGGTDSYDGEGGILRHIIPIKKADLPAQFKVTILVEDVNYSGESVTMLYFPVEKYAPTGGWKASAEEFTVTDNAFTITTPGQLAYLASALSDDTIRAQYNSSEITYTLGADLDMSAHGWNTVIGKSAAAAFAATFDGNGHTVSGLYSSKTLGKNEVTCSGLFGYVTGTVKNLNIDRSYFYVLGAGPSDPGKYCGAIAAVLAEGGTIENCKADVRIDGGKYARIGGIVGYLEGGTVTGCTNQGFISVEDHGSGGGIAGYTDKNGNTISYCTNTGTVTKPGGYGNIGGILGEKLSSAQINLTDNTDQGILERE